MLSADRVAEAAKPKTVVPDRLRLTPLEELWGIPVGMDRGTPPLATDVPTPSPRQALETAVISALRRPPCLVSFSGGVDSSSVLALAAHVARREGLPAPVPITNRFPGLEEAQETPWQELVIAHLGLDDWVRLEWEDELDLIGPIANRVLRRHGLLFPFNCFFHDPMLDRARGGSLLTGIGGDELFTRTSRHLVLGLLYDRRAPRAHELHSLAFQLAPRRVRATVDTWRDDYFDQFPWIRGVRRRTLRRANATWQSRKPLRNDRALLEWWWSSRMLQCGLAGMRALAADFDVLPFHPLADPKVLQAFARAGGATGLGAGSRRRAVSELLSDLLPRETLQRRTKTTFDGAFWTRHARSFAGSWDGSGVDAGQVDIDALRTEWAKDAPFPQSFVLLQRAWLGQTGKP